MKEVIGILLLLLFVFLVSKDAVSDDSMTFEDEVITIDGMNVFVDDNVRVITDMQGRIYEVPKDIYSLLDYGDKLKIYYVRYYIDAVLQRDIYRIEIIRKGNK